MFCKSPTVATLFGLDFVKSTNPADESEVTGVAEEAFGFNAPFASTSVALCHSPSFAFTKSLPSASFAASNVLAPFATLPNVIERPASFAFAVGLITFATNVAPSTTSPVGLPFASTL